MVQTFQPLNWNMEPRLEAQLAVVFFRLLLIKPPHDENFHLTQMMVAHMLGMVLILLVLRP